MIAFKLAGALIINDEDKVEVLAYGTFVLIQTLLSIAMVALFGVIFNVLIEALIISFAASILRKFSGGAHATTPMNCAIIGMVIFGVQAILVKNYLINIEPLFLYLGIIIMILFTYIMIHRLSPVGTPTKPLKNDKTRKRLNLKSKRFVLFMFFITIGLLLLYNKVKYSYLLTIACCISIGFIWQSITLVSLGHIIIDGFDKLLGGTNRFLRRMIL